MSASISPARCSYCPVKFTGKLAHWQVRRHMVKSHPEKLKNWMRRWLKDG